jgi:hypothetical protein
VRLIQISEFDQLISLNPMELESMVSFCPNCLRKNVATKLSIKECLYIRMNNWLKELFAANQTQALETITQIVGGNTSSASASASATTAKTDDNCDEAIPTDADNGSASSPAPVLCVPVHPRLWACPNKLSNGKVCKIANLRDRPFCYKCRQTRPGLSQDEAEKLQAAATGSQVGAKRRFVGEGMPAKENKTDNELDEHESLLARAIDVLTKEDNGLSPDKVEGLSDTIESYSSLIETAKVARSPNMFMILRRIQSLLEPLLVEYSGQRATDLDVAVGGNNISSNSSSGSSFSRTQTQRFDGGSVGGFGSGFGGGFGNGLDGNNSFGSGQMPASLRDVFGDRPVQFLDMRNGRMGMQMPQPTKIEPWTCLHCTFYNEQNLNVCVVCETSRDIMPAFERFEEIPESTPVAATTTQQNAGSELDAAVGVGAAQTGPSVVPVLVPTTGGGSSETAVPMQAAASRMADLPVRRARSEATPADVNRYPRLYAVVKESFVIPREKKACDDSAMSISSSSAPTSTSPGAVSLGGDVEPPPPGSPIKMYRAFSAPVTTREGEKAQACISPYMKEERLMWDQILAAVKSEQE